MDGPSQPENAAKFSKRQLAEKFRKGIGHLNPQILDDPNYQETNNNIPENARKQLEEQQKLINQTLQEQSSRRTILGTIGTGLALLGIKTAWGPVSERLQQEAKYREDLKTKREQSLQKNEIPVTPPGTVSAIPKK